MQHFHRAREGMNIDATPCGRTTLKLQQLTSFEAKCFQQVHKIGWSNVQINVFEIEQGGKSEATQQNPSLRIEKNS
jgi:hypothetical protein